MIHAIMGRTLQSLVLLGLGAGAAHARADEPNLTGPATESEIAALAAALSDPSFAARTLATRRLCAIGNPASDRLRRVAAGDDAEAAIRARRVLAVLDGLLFAGVEIHLALSRPAVAWDESVDLVITVTNRSDYPARVPFLIDPTRRAALTEDAAQVADMLDAAEYARVAGPDGRRLELRVDDITADAEVRAVVHERIEGGPIGELQPGARTTITVRGFNRGWARYRMLDRGSYKVVLDYVPAWQDELLAAQRVGQVTSNQATLTVTQGAPQAVSRRGVESSVDLRRDAASLVAELTNHTDMPMLVNTNFGAVPPFVDGRWVWERGNTREEVPVGKMGGAGWRDFDPALLVELSPGGSLTLASIDIGALRRALADAGVALDGKPGDVYFVYANLLDRTWQTRQGPSFSGNSDVPAVLRNALPRNVLSVRQTSGFVALPPAD